MSNQINKSNLFDLTTTEQQLISGGCQGCYPRYQPRQCCGYKPYQSTNQPYYETQPYEDFGDSSW